MAQQPATTLTMTFDTPTDPRTEGDHPRPIPLCLDLDGTLLRSDLLIESALALLARNPLWLLLFPWWLLGGKANLKRQIAGRVVTDASHLPFDTRVVALAQEARAAGRPVILCTASDELLARPIVEHLQFDGLLASDGATNLSGSRKAQALVERYGDKGFDYAGNASVDLHVWKRARQAIVLGPDALARRASAMAEVGLHLPSPQAGLRTWTKAIRAHQWLKNLLVFVPLLASHRFMDAHALVQAVVAFFAFSLCASGVYVLNDLLDLPSDRRHPRKRNRPFASGQVLLLHGILAAPALTIAGFALALVVSPGFFGVLIGYYILTLAYSLQLKRVVVLDVILLAALYTIRIIGGAIAIDSELSFWLLAFSMFMFLSLAMLKRYTELSVMLANGRGKASGRGYAVEDLPLIQSLGAASGYIAVMVLALYINSPESVALYSQPKLIWLICPLVLYWISRAWVVAHRGQMDDDPIVFAVKDRPSQLVGIVAAATIFFAT